MAHMHPDKIGSLEIYFRLSLSGALMAVYIHIMGTVISHRLTPFQALTLYLLPNSKVPIPKGTVGVSRVSQVIYCGRTLEIATSWG